MSAVDHVAEIQKQIDDLLAPLREQDERLTQEIGEHRQAVSDLRSLQNKVQALIRASDPEYQKHPKKNGKGQRQTWPKDQVRADRLGEFFVANAAALNEMNDGEGFYATGLERAFRAKEFEAPLGVSHASEITKAQHVLHERGVIRLLKIGSGGRKYYKVVA